MNKRYYIEPITGTREDKIVDRLGHKYSIVTVHDDNEDMCEGIDYFIDHLNYLSDEVHYLREYCADLEDEIKRYLWVS